MFIKFINASIFYFCYQIYIILYQIYTILYYSTTLLFKPKQKTSPNNNVFSVNRSDSFDSLQFDSPDKFFVLTDKRPQERHQSNMEGLKSPLTNPKSLDFFISKPSLPNKTSSLNTFNDISDVNNVVEPQTISFEDNDVQFPQFPHGFLIYSSPNESPCTNRSIKYGEIPFSQMISRSLYQPSSITPLNHNDIQRYLDNSLAESPCTTCTNRSSNSSNNSLFSKTSTPNSSFTTFTTPGSSTKSTTPESNTKCTTPSSYTKSMTLGSYKKSITPGLHTKCTTPGSYTTHPTTESYTKCGNITPKRTRPSIGICSPGIFSSAWIPRREMKILHPSKLSPSMINEFTTTYAHILEKSYFESIGRTSRKFRPPEFTEKCRNDYFTDKFIIEKVLGVGEFSIAYKVKDTKTKISYAIKKRKVPFESHSNRIENLEEVEIMWKIGEHSNCVQLFSAWEQKGFLYLQTELCEFGTLETFLEYSGKLKECVIWRIITDIAHGLEHIHKCNVMHLDLKPGNIFQSSNGIFKIGDFGLSASWPPKPNLDKQGDCRYLSLEALNNYYDFSADIYSLGVIILEMMINKLSKDLANKIRLGNLNKLKFRNMSNEIITLSKAMVQINYKSRPTIQQIVKICNKH
ncbi:11530_t:CDS:1 [Diversispora eburnea]|uniref:11530_t:CDS:1 n=1 Tax=Diversispora eburnea TaxID=1213867 RepID=A0A9N9FJS1_9GLOM|nr:11530_t:CDS:1 [Diversispora eburnea]